jgi:dihydroorotase
VSGTPRPILIRGGRLIDPSQGHDAVADILLVGGSVAGQGANVGAPDGAEVIDATGLVVAPGLVDLHVHLREPGREDAETIATGARAAAAGGFTSVCAMPNTDPVCDNQAAVGFVLAQAHAAGTARVYPIGSVSMGQKGEQLTEFGELVAAGAVAVSDDGRPVATAHLMRTALEYARSFGIPVIDHCEDRSLAEGGAMHEGLTSTRLGLKGMPRSAEDLIVARDILLAELTGGHVHLAHMSTAGAVRLIREAKSRGVNVTAEVTPHHLTLTDVCCEGYNTNAKMNPPLREQHDVTALKEGLRDGTIDCIATDHAPHPYDAKEQEFDFAPFGVVGLETALGLAMVELVEPGTLALPELVRRMATRPAEIAHLPGGTLRRGAPADVVVFDPAASWTVEPAAFFSKSRNTPFAGRVLKGRVRWTVVGGLVVHHTAASGRAVS